MPPESRLPPSKDSAILETLRRNEQFFQTLVRNTSTVIQLIGTDSIIRYLNPSVEQVLGFKPEELVGQSVIDLIHPDELDEMQQSFMQLAGQSGATTQVEQRIRHKDGSWRWVEVTATNLLEDPAVEAVLVSYHDVTQRKAVEEALRQEQYLMRSLMENVPDAIYFKDEQSKFIRVNPALAHKHGLENPQDVVGKSDFDFFEKESAATYRAEELAIMDSGQPVVNLEEMERWSGRPATWASTTKMVLRDVKGQVVGTFGLTRDITESKVAEAALRQSEHNLAAAQALAHLGSWELDLTNLNDINENPLRWSDEVYRIFGYEPGAIAPTNEAFFNAVPPEERPAIVAAVDEAIREHKQYNLNHRIMRPDGTIRFVHEQSDIVYDEITGRPLMMAGIVHDITDQQLAEAALAAKSEEVREMTQQLWETAKLATMGELAASLAHELNNPLATIHLRVEALLAGLPADATQRRPLEIVEQEAERMARLVANLLHFSRRSTRQISTLDVRDEIQSTLELLQYHIHQRHIDIIEDYQADLPMVHFDRQQLRQVLVNLLTNASDAMPKGGSVTLRAKTQAGWLLLEVIDTGSGINPGQLAFVTEPFFTTKPEGKGTGLGLAICRRIMQEHGGKLEIQSEGIPDKGTRVQLWLALPDTNPAQTVTA